MSMQLDYFRTVMPSIFVPEDAAWIQDQMRRLSPSMRQRIALKYAEVYQQVFESEPVTFRQENRARNEANTRLRLFVERYQSAAMGLTEKPALASAIALTAIAAGTDNQEAA